MGGGREEIMEYLHKITIICIIYFNRNNSLSTVSEVTQG